LFYSAMVLNARPLLMSGVTRDGTFLIEGGRIVKPIKNLRFSESPFFIFNKIDAFGVPVRTAAGQAVPRLKVHDFEFMSQSRTIGQPLPRAGCPFSRDLRAARPSNYRR